MSDNQKSRFQDFRGPSPHSVPVRAQFPSSRPSDLFVMERRRLEAGKENFAAFTKDQKAWDMKNSWIENSDQLYVRRTTKRGVKAAVDQYQLSVEERRERLRIMLKTEEQQFLKEMEEKRDSTLETQDQKRERAKVLKEKREAKRQQIVSEKMEQLFINQCEEVRIVLAKRREEEARLECAAQMQSKQEQQRQQQIEDRQFAEMQDAIHQREKQKARERAEQQQQERKENLNYLRTQMDAAEQQRQQADALKEEEAQLLCEHRELLMLQEQRETSQRLKAQQTRRKQLDQSYRMKMKHLAKEQQEELALDMSILQQVLRQESNAKQDAAHKRDELREEQQRYRQYLADELAKQKQLEQEREQIIEENMRETWAKREKQSQMERDARNKLMNEVLESHRVQIQHKLELNKQKQEELARDGQEYFQMAEEMKLMARKEKRQQEELYRAYQADLQAQMLHKQQLKQNEKALEDREFQQGLAMQQEYEKMKERILSRPGPHTTGAPPFRRTD